MIKSQQSKPIARTFDYSYVNKTGFRQGVFTDGETKKELKGISAALLNLLIKSKKSYPK